MLVLTALRQNGLKRVESTILSSPTKTIVTLKMVQTRKSHSLHEIDDQSDRSEPPLKKLKALGKYAKT